MQEASKLETLRISEILPNRFQPRIKFDDESLNQLAASIARFGVIEPIVVRPIGKKYEIIAGERRFKASKLAGKSTIPAMILNLSDKDSEELALLENIQRKSLSPIEEAVSYKRILDSGYISRDELSRKIGKPQSLVFNKIRLLDLADEVQSYLLNNKISERHARSLLKLSSLSDQVDMLHRIVKERLTVKATDREIDKLIEKNKGINNNIKDNNFKTSEDSDVTENLFDDERGSENMDIDKIMREAKDINAPEVETSNESVPDLMATGKEVQDELQVNNSLQNEDPVEPGKFVNVIPQDNDKQVTNSAPSFNSSVTFDNMFNSPAINVDSKPLAQTSSVPGDNNIFNSSASLVEPFVKPAPELINSVQDNENASGPLKANDMLNDNVSVQVPLKSELEGGQNSSDSKPSTVLPADLKEPASELQNPGVVPPMPTMKQDIKPASELQSPGVVPPLPAMKPDIEPASELQSPGVVPPMPAMKPGVEPASELQNLGVVPPMPAMKPDIEPASELQNPGVVPPMPAMKSDIEAASELQSPAVVPPMPAMKPDIEPASELQNPGVVPLMSNVKPVVEPAPKLPNPGSFHSMPRDINSNPQSISAAVSDALKKFNNSEVSNNIPDVNIYNDKNVELQGLVGDGVISNNTSDGLPENIITDSSNIPNFAKIVKMLRDCADEIQRIGYYVNVDEMDVDGKYKVIFTIDKE